jgi:hypothetical protein
MNTQEPSSVVTNVDEYRQYKELLARLTPAAVRILSQIHQSEEAFLGARAIEILSEG